MGAVRGSLTLKFSAPIPGLPDLPPSLAGRVSVKVFPGGKRAIEVTFSDGECVEFPGDDVKAVSQVGSGATAPAWDDATAEAARSFGFALVARLLAPV